MSQNAILEFMSFSPRLITRFFFPTPEMKARDQAVSTHHRNQESVNWLPRYYIMLSVRISPNGGQHRYFALFSKATKYTTTTEPFNEDHGSGAASIRNILFETGFAGRY